MNIKKHIYHFGQLDLFRGLLQQLVNDGGMLTKATGDWDGDAIDSVTVQLQRGKVQLHITRCICGSA